MLFLKILEEVKQFCYEIHFPEQRVKYIVFWGNGESKILFGFDLWFKLLSFDVYIKLYYFIIIKLNFIIVRILKSIYYIKVGLSLLTIVLHLPIYNTNKLCIFVSHIKGR